MCSSFKMADIKLEVALGVLVAIIGFLSVCSTYSDLTQDGESTRNDMKLATMREVQANGNGKGQDVGLDEAIVTIVTFPSVVRGDRITTIEIYKQYDVCDKCSFVKWGRVVMGQNVTIVVSTQFPLTLVFFEKDTTSDSVGKVCEKSVHYREHGHYQMYVDPKAATSKDKCNLVIPPDAGVDSYVPLYVATAVLIIASLVWMLIVHLHRRNMFSLLLVTFNYRRSEDLVRSDLGTTSHSGMVPDLPLKPRLKSLDTFRGLSLVIMIFVNYGGGRYWFMRHSAWNGLTVADLVFPWFTFIMGTSMALSFRAMVVRGVSRHDLAWKVVRRSVILFMLGLMLSNSGKHGHMDVADLRIPGVLQRLAVTYCIVAMMEACFARPDVPPSNSRAFTAMNDVLMFWPEWLIVFAIVGVHLGLTFGLPLEEGCPTGYLGPGGLHDNSSYVNCTGGAAGLIDRWVFGTNHIYQHPTFAKWYLTADLPHIPYDPEGILGTLTSVLICFLGLHAGKILLYFQDWVARIKRWMVWMFLTGLIAGLLCDFSQNDGYIPLNKNFWSLSFVLALSSMAFLLLTILYLVIDVFHLWSGTPFFYPGMNSIVIYVCHEVFEDYFPVQFKVEATHAALLAMNMYGAAIWTIVAIVLHHKGVFIAI